MYLARGRGCGVWLGADRHSLLRVERTVARGSWAEVARSAHSAAVDHMEGPAYLSHMVVSCSGLGTEPHAKGGGTTSTRP
jgi:hypothetical protein